MQYRSKENKPFFMKIQLTIISILLCLNHVLAHQHHDNPDHSRIWNLNNQEIDGWFLYNKYDSIFITNHENSIIGFSIHQLSTNDKIYVEKRIAEINELNESISVHHTGNKKINHFAIAALALLIISATWYASRSMNKSKTIQLLLPLFFGASFIIVGFTDPNIIKNAFLPFAPNVNTFWDDTYFYVESKGIPATHEMMVGISNHGWQQQVPIPQCYIGANAWSIPLNPVMSSNPIPVDDVHFTRGAIAIAVNGVPIFNPHTNTGVDALTDGQLDLYGGHCGRGDDYHYHIAPLHLYNSNFSHLPIAYAFDGFAVYGNLEPDGSVMATLDNNHGHFYNGEYHYHGTSASPYMIAQFAGVVTEDATHQLIPQAQAHPVRTENWTPLNGALITACLPNNSGNGYQLNYSLNNTAGYAVNYAWNGTTYTFDYITPNSNNTIEYIGFEQCQIPTAIQQADYPSPSTLFPNPFIDHVQLTNPTKGQYFQLFNATGQLLFSTFDLYDQNFSQLSSGTYFLNVLPDHQTYRLIKN